MTRPAEPTEGQRQAARQVLSQWLRERYPLLRGEAMADADALLAGPLVPFLAEAEARGHARGAAEAAEAVATVERVRAFVDGFRDRARSKPTATDELWIIAIRRALDGDV